MKSSTLSKSFVFIDSNNFYPTDNNMQEELELQDPASIASLLNILK